MESLMGLKGREIWMAMDCLIPETTTLMVTMFRTALKEPWTLMEMESRISSILILTTTAFPMARIRIEHTGRNRPVCSIRILAIGNAVVVRISIEEIRLSISISVHGSFSAVRNIVTISVVVSGIRQSIAIQISRPFNPIRDSVAVTITAQTRWLTGIVNEKRRSCVTRKRSDVDSGYLRTAEDRLASRSVCTGTYNHAGIYFIDTATSKRIKGRVVSSSELTP